MVECLKQMPQGASYQVVEILYLGDFVVVEPKLSQMSEPRQVVNPQEALEAEVQCLQLAVLEVGSLLAGRLNLIAKLRVQVVGVNWVPSRQF